jgi:hypothetical protein
MNAPGFSRVATEGSIRGRPGHHRCLVRMCRCARVRARDWRRSPLQSMTYELASLCVLGGRRCQTLPCLARGRKLRPLTRIHHSRTTDIRLLASVQTRAGLLPTHWRPDCRCWATTGLPSVWSTSGWLHSDRFIAAATAATAATMTGGLPSADLLPRRAARPADADATSGTIGPEAGAYGCAGFAEGRQQGRVTGILGPA